MIIVVCVQAPGPSGCRRTVALSSLSTSSAPLRALLAMPPPAAAISSSSSWGAPVRRTVPRMVGGRRGGTVGKQQLLVQQGAPLEQSRWAGGHAAQK